MSGHQTEQRYFADIMTNDRQTVLYTGVTGDLVRRAFERRPHALSGFSSRYNLNKLLFYQEFHDPDTATTPEKQIKAGSPRKKVAVIDAFNPGWRVLYEDLL